MWRVLGLQVNKFENILSALQNLHVEKKDALKNKRTVFFMIITCQIARLDNICMVAGYLIHQPCYKFYLYSWLTCT